MKILKTNFPHFAGEKSEVQKRVISSKSPQAPVPISELFLLHPGREAWYLCVMERHSHWVIFLNSFLALGSCEGRLCSEQDVSRGALEMAH